MAKNLQVALFTVWFLTGSVKKMEDFVLEIWNGRIFLLDDSTFLPTNKSDIAGSELLKVLLLYNPPCQSIGPDPESALEEATRFTTFIGDPPSAKPWIAEWVSERNEVLTQAEEEIGAEAVNEILACSGTSDD